MEKDEKLRQRKKKKKSVSSDSEEDLPQKSVTVGTPGAPPVSPYGKALTRSVMGAFMIAIFTGVLLSDHIIISLFIIGLQILVFREILHVRYNVSKEKELYGFNYLTWFFLWNTVFYFYGKPFLLFLPFKNSNFIQNITRYHIGISFTLYVIGFVTFILMLRRRYLKYQITQMTWTIMILVLIIAQSNFIVKNLFEGIVWFLVPCSIIVCNDIAAYFSGFFFGKKFINKPFLKISPNKTWEGFIGATFWTLLFAFYFAGFIAQFQWFICPRAEVDAFKPLSCKPDAVFIPKNYYLPTQVAQFLTNLLHWDFSYITVRPIQFHSLVFALFGSLIAPFGGFFASGIKRAYGLKDFNTIFPGHGGFTDRTDCQYIMGMFTYVYYFMFIRTSIQDVNSVFESILELSLPDQQVLLSRLNDTVIRTLEATAAGY